MVEIIQQEKDKKKKLYSKLSMARGTIVELDEEDLDDSFEIKRKENELKKIQ